MAKGCCVYILVNNRHTVFYVGATSNLYARITQHREKVNSRSFTARYNINKLVYYETFDSRKEAIAREKQLKTYSRIKKIELIVGFNPEWNDLYNTVKYW
ncbi:GIY-YIG nuclease family protein [Chryseolinea soli]|uniref:GIY-YIG nuclease family protein n=1 Tax=Chryseolinea soli TaxID=2321403 RepID=A0A385SSQ9_9BACT|nr:GIY-YIG nuclease family protein [Chryseolinea soli]AYB32710.1 GIY-YIG nuclease family protein [Chryseolinea soli]